MSLFKIPNNKRFIQSSDSTNQGNFLSTFNVDLTSNKGRLKTTRTKIVTNDDDQADLQEVIAFENYNNLFYGASNDNIYKGGNLPNEPFVKDTSTGSPTELSVTNTDTSIFNGSLYVSNNKVTTPQVNIHTLTGSTWANPITNTGISEGTSPILLEPLQDRLYFTYDFTKVGSLDTSNTESLTGNPYTIDLQIMGASISMLKASGNTLWIGTVSTSGNSPVNGWVYEWDGITQNTYINRYKIDSAGVVAGVVRTSDQTPFILDTKGRLMQFNGAGFTEVARLPIDIELDDATEETNSRFVHPNGMIERDGKILIFINNKSTGNNNITRATHEFLPSGVWEWSPETGLYHKYSISNFDIADSGTTNLTDYGQERVEQVGAIFDATKYVVSSNDTDMIGDLLIGGSYYDTSGANQKYGIWVNDTEDDTQKCARYITPELDSFLLSDRWKEIAVILREVMSSGDEVSIKYRNSVHEPIDASITWTDTSTITSTDDLSDYVAGDEVTITQATGSGKSAHITSISENAGTYTISLDSSFTGASGTSEARFDKWTKLHSIDQVTSNILNIPINIDSNWIQFKIELCYTGKNELQEIQIASSSSKRI